MSRASVDIGELPIWRGAQLAPGIDCAPFGFELDETGLVRLTSPDVIQQMMDAYAADDYHFITTPPGASQYGNRLAGFSLDGLSKLCGDISGLDVLELGGGTLYSAQYLIDQLGAASVTLVDPALHTPSDRDDIRVRREYFGDDTVVQRSFPLIVSFNTLEHVPDPLGFLQAARKHLADDGRMYLKMPESGQSLSRGDLGLCVHEHLSYFTPGSLAALLRQAGFEQTGDASYMGALQIVCGKSEPDPAARQAISDETLAAFGRRCQAHIDRLVAFADAHPGESVAFVGASVGLANVLHLSRMHERMAVEIFDGEVLKEGRYLPGVEIPIKVTDDPALEAHRYIFITPMNFYAEIRASLEARFAGQDVEIRPVFPEVA